MNNGANDIISEIKSGRLPFGPHQCMRTRLPDEREARVIKFKINAEDGPHTGYIDVGLYDDGSPGEVFIYMDKAGSRARGFLDAWAITVSVALQHGVPLGTICSKLARMRFNPQGHTGEADFGFATSPIDIIARKLARHFDIDLEAPEEAPEFDPRTLDPNDN
jgi:ribonucleoside-diphosphate reductase alpha chain